MGLRFCSLELKIWVNCTVALAQGGATLQDQAGVDRCGHPDNNGRQ